MFYALQELYAGQPVLVGGKPTQVLMAARGLVWLGGFANPVPTHAVEAC